jgi:hypothetical protein
MEAYKSKFQENNGEDGRENSLDIIVSKLSELFKNVDKKYLKDFVKAHFISTAISDSELESLADDVLNGEDNSFKDFGVIIEILKERFNESYSRQFKERATREEYGDFEDELERAKELYEDFKSKVDKAFSFNVKQLKMKDLDDKRNQLSFIIETLELVNDQI